MNAPDTIDVKEIVEMPVAKIQALTAIEALQFLQALQRADAEVIHAHQQEARDRVVILIAIVDQVLYGATSQVDFYPHVVPKTAKLSQPWSYGDFYQQAEQRGKVVVKKTELECGGKLWGFRRGDLLTSDNRKSKWHQKIVVMQGYKQEQIGETWSGFTRYSLYGSILFDDNKYPDPDMMCANTGDGLRLIKPREEVTRADCDPFPKRKSPLKITGAKDLERFWE